MWRNYLTVGIRSLGKSRAYALINILGLAIGMAACLMILLFVRYELRYDHWLPGAENAYQFQAWYKSDITGDDTGELQMTAYVSGKALKKDFPQVEKEVYVLGSQPVFVKDGQVSSTENLFYVDGDLLDVLHLPMAKGDPRTLDKVGGAVITESEAIKRYGTDDVIGKTMTLISKGVKRDYRIGGVLRDIPKNSHLKINMIVRIDMVAFFAQEPDFLTCWGCQSGWVYLRLKPGTDPAAIEAQLKAWEKRNTPDQNAGEARYNAGDDQDWRVVNVRDVHLGKAQGGAMTPGNDRRTISTFAVIALLILGMACVNFTNLATARASQRAREVALRKVLGASRKQLIFQFIGESVLVAAIAMLLALALVELLIGPFSTFLKADLSVTYFGADGIILPVIALVLFVGVLGGLYPAFFLSRFQPAEVLKANRSAAETPGSGRLRNILVVGQFAVSIGLIICTGVIYAQTIFARTVDPGYKRDHILQVDNLSRYQLLQQGEMIADQVRRVDGVISVGRTDIGVATTNNSNTNVMVPGNPKPVQIGQYRIDAGFFDAMGIELLAGRSFDRKRPMDDSTLPFPEDKEAERLFAARGTNIVVNELATRRMGFKHPADAIGKTVRLAYVAEEFGLVPATIIGVVKDARFRSIRTPLEPIMFFNVLASPSTMVVRYRGDPAAVSAGVERVWKSITTEVPYEAKFSEDIVKDLYEAEEARAATFGAFAVLAVIVGCLGLFGLATFTAERRTKEIGIRKVLGARTRDIVQLLVWQFSRPVLIANLIAWPIAWWLMRDWLNGFDSRIALGPTPFLLAGLLALLIAVATIGSHAYRVARANPVHALRYE
ncbi:ABC transporter permease [Sphingomonas sp. DBB INV C78]|uniref:ABC transporter permease n=1 Tax=Sphingomonas sp. DBB INV C78 TaxID=3349434 RepID=UPI0036D3DAD8